MDHKHSGTSSVTPQERHSGRDGEILAQGKVVHEAARKRRPDPWPGGERDWSRIDEVILNPNTDRQASEANR